MRIALATDWFAPRPGGIESQLVGLATGMAARGNTVDVITSTPGATTAAHYRVRRVTTATVPGLDLALSPALLPEMRRLLSQQYDVVHAHVSVVSPVAYAALWAAHRLRLPTVVTFHSVLRGMRLLLAITSPLASLRRRPMVWAAVSHKVSEQLRNALAGVSVEVLSNGIDLAFWRGSDDGRGPVAATAPRHAEGAPVRFISAMRLHSKKRPRALLHAFAAAARTMPGRATLTFVGDGPERAALERDARASGLSDHQVELLPWASPSALRALYDRSDVFVSACEREAFGIAALEARAAGLPVVAMRAAGSTEFLRDGVDALLCDSDDALADAIRRCVSDHPLRCALASATPTLDRYDWPGVLEAHEAAYALATRRVHAASPVAP